MKYQVSVKVTQYGKIAVEARNFNEAKVLAELQYSKGNTDWIDSNAELHDVRELPQVEISESPHHETQGSFSFLCTPTSTSGPSTSGRHTLTASPNFS